MLCTRIHAKKGILLAVPYSRLAPVSCSVSLAVHLFSHIVASFKSVRALLMFLILLLCCWYSQIVWGKEMITELCVRQSE